MGEVRDRNREKFLSDPTDPRHGTPNGYSNLGCRGEICDGACTRANTNYHLDFMHRHPEHREKAADSNMRRLGKTRQSPYTERPERWKEPYEPERD